MLIHKPCGMAATKDFRQEARRIGARIRQIREANKLGLEDVGRVYKTGPDAIRHIEAGQSGSDGFVKLARLAIALKSTPNEILDFKKIDERERFQGILEGVALAFGLPLTQAQALADIVLEALDSPDMGNAGLSAQDTARSIGAFVARRFLQR